MQLSPGMWVSVLDVYKIGGDISQRDIPLKKYNMVPEHPFLKQIVSCMSMVIPANFYDRVREGSLILKKAQSFSFCRNGLVLDGEAAVLETDIVIFATGYKSDEKLSNIFTSTFFKNCITGSSAPFYR